MGILVPADCRMDDKDRYSMENILHHVELDEEFLKNLLKNKVADRLNQDCLRLQEAFEQQDTYAIAEIAHEIKGAMYFFGFNTLCERLKAMEEAVEETETVEPRFFESVATEIQAINSFIETL